MKCGPSHSEPQENIEPNRDQINFSCAAQILHSASVPVLGKSATSPARQCTRSSAFQQLHSNTFREDKGLACSMKVPLINKKLLPLALHKRSQELAAKHEREGEWRLGVAGGVCKGAALGRKCFATILPFVSQFSLLESDLHDALRWKLFLTASVFFLHFGF